MKNDAQATRLFNLVIGAERAFDEVIQHYSVDLPEELRVPIVGQATRVLWVADVARVLLGYHGRGAPDLITDKNSAATLRKTGCGEPQAFTPDALLRN